MTPSSEAQRLRQALAQGDDETALGAFRLLEATNRTHDLSAEELAQVAGAHERRGLHFEAARLLRLSAEKEPSLPQASEWLWRAACLLTGPSGRPDLGALLAGRLAEQGATPEIRAVAQDLQNALAKNDAEAVCRALERSGIDPTDYWRQHLQTSQTQRAAAVPVRTDFQAKTGKWPLRILPVFLLSWLIGWLMGDRLGGVGSVRAELFLEPRQEPLEEERVVTMQRGGMNFALTERFRYRICGLVVSVNTYAMLGLRFQDFFQRDFCMIWGDNVSAKLFRAPGTSFEHHGNVCYYNCRGPLCPNGRQLSNTHVFPADEQVAKDIEKIRVGDQVCLEGKLVDVSAVPIKAPGGSIPTPARLSTSTTREDNGMGACEIMLVETADVLERANRIWRLLASLGLWGAAACAGVMALMLAIRMLLRRGATAPPSRF